MHDVCRDVCRSARNMKFVTAKDGREKELRVCQFSCKEMCFALQSTNGAPISSFPFLFLVVLVLFNHHRNTHFISERKTNKQTG